MKWLARVLHVLFLLVLTALAAPAFAKTLTIAIDRSESNPIVTSKPFADAAAVQAQGAIAVLQLGDYVRIRHFGERGEHNLASETIRITRQNRIVPVAHKVAAHIASLPSKTETADKQTNLLAALEFGSFDCANGGQILLITDGIEASATMSSKEFLSGKPLPAPPEFLKGCEIWMFSPGATKDGSLPPQIVKSIRLRWSDYFAAAGAKFTAIVDP